MQDLPHTLRAVDLRGLAQAAAPLLPPGTGLGDIEKVLGFVERVVPLFEKFSASMIAMRQSEGANGHQGAANGVNNEIWEDMPQDMRAAPPPRQTVQPVAAPLPAIDPLRVYAALLGAMAQAPEGMLVSDALILAREHKELIIPQIQAELNNL
jgi:hypothetical protein